MDTKEDIDNFVEEYKKLSSTRASLASKFKISIKTVDVLSKALKLEPKLKGKTQKLLKLLGDIYPDTIIKPDVENNVSLIHTKTEHQSVISEQQPLITEKQPIDEAKIIAEEVKKNTRKKK